MHNIAIFASGNGTNAENIARYFADSKIIKVKCVLSNNDKAYVHQRMKPFGVPSITFGRDIWEEAKGISEYLKSEGIELIVLAGFLSFINKPLLDAFENRIINLHPSLLPKYGGKGMYGIRVHEAVINAHETESGITIHYVTDKIDGGAIICQKKCAVYPSDSAESLSKRVSELEYRWLPRTIETIFTNKL